MERKNIIKILVIVNIVLLCAVAYLASTDGKFGKNGKQNGGFGEPIEIDTISLPAAQVDSLSPGNTIDETRNN